MIDWTDIDTVLLDMDGTLLDLQFDNFFWEDHLPRAYARHHGLAERAAIELLQRRLKAGVGTLDWYCLDHWSQQLDMDIAALKRDIGHRVRLRPHALDFLSSLRAHRLDMVLVTNAHHTTLQIKMEQVNIRPWFDRVVVSHELRAAKEEAAFWHRLQALHPFDPARTLLIDDTERVLEAARDYGIAHLLTLLQPDSSQGKRLDTQFPGIHHFDEIMPPEPVS